MPILQILGCVVLLWGSTACSTVREFTPEAVANNEAVSLSVRKTKVRGDHVFIWASLRNLSDQTLTANYGGFYVEVDGALYGGVLRVPFARVTKNFDLAPKTYKRIDRPLYFNVPSGLDRPIEQLVLQLQGVRSGSAEAAAVGTVSLPLRVIDD